MGLTLTINALRATKKSSSLWQSVALSIALLCLLLGVSAPTFSLDDTTQRFRQSLSSEELAWIDTNPTVRFAGDPNWLPFEAFNNNNEYLGIVAEHLELLAEITKITFVKTQTQSWSETLERANNAQVDVISGDASDVVLSKNYRAVTPYLSNKISILTKKSAANIDALEDIADKRIGFIKGYGYTSALQREYPNIPFIEVENIQTGLEHVSVGKLDALLTSNALGSYSKIIYGYNNIKFAGSTRVTMELTLFVVNDKPELFGIIDKALTMIRPDQRFDITSRWTHYETRYNELSITLTPSERRYLRSISPITFTGDPNWLPYEAFNKDGEYIGQVADHLKIIEQLLEIEFTIIPTKTWSESLELSRTKKVDILSEVDSSILGGGYPFTRTYSNSPVVIVMAENTHFVSSLNEISDKRIGLIKDYGNTHVVQRKYPLIDFEVMPTLQDGLIAVSSGSIDALLMNSAQAVFHIKRMGLDNIKIAGKTEFDMRLAFAINPDKKGLVPILNKALDVIYLSREQKAIYDKWANVEVSSRLDYSLAYKVLAAALVLGLLGALWTFRLKHEIVKREELTEQLSMAKEQANSANEAKSRFLAVMSHELRTPLHGILGMLELLEKSTLATEQMNAVRITKESSESLLGILNDILDFSKIEANHLDINEEACDLKFIIEKCVNAQAQNAYKKGLNINMFIAPDLARGVYIDSTRVRQVISNFINNAIKFTTDGAITISADCNIDGENLDFIIEIEDTGIGISEENQTKLFQEFVQINMESKRQFGGTGLGLSICRKLVHLMGGEISLRSEVGKGTKISYQQIAKLEKPISDEKAPKKWNGIKAAIVTSNNFVAYCLNKTLHYYAAECHSILERDIAHVVKAVEKENYNVIFIDDSILSNHAEKFSSKVIRLVDKKDLSANNYMAEVGILNTNPLQPRFLELLIDLCAGIESQDDLFIPKDPSKIAHKNTNILVAEDHPTNRELIARQLERLGYLYTIAENGQQASEFWLSGSYDAVITDCHMPVMDGYELARFLRSNAATSVPIIAMTANALSGERERCINSGMSDMLLKPTNLQTLESCLEKWLPPPDDVTDTGESCNRTVNIDHLEEIFFGRDNVLPMLSSYWDATDQDLVDLRLASEQRNFESIRKIAHRIKGAAKIVVAEDLVILSQTLENLATSDDEKDRESSIDSLITRLGQALSAHKHLIMNNL